MASGYMGKLLFVDLSTGEIREESLDEKISRDFIGGYGLGCRMLYSRQKPESIPRTRNTLGILTGPSPARLCRQAPATWPWPDRR